MGLDLVGWLQNEMVGVPAHRQSPISVLRPGDDNNNNNKLTVFNTLSHGDHYKGVDARVDKSLVGVSMK